MIHGQNLSPRESDSRTPAFKHWAVLRLMAHQRSFPDPIPLLTASTPCPRMLIPSTVPDTWGAPMLGCSVQFSCSVLSDSLWPHESQHARPLCPWPTPRIHPDPCPMSWWCHPTISSSVVPFSSGPQSLPASGSFQWVNSSHEVAKVLEFQL